MKLDYNYGKLKKVFYVLLSLYILILLAGGALTWNWYDVQWFLKWTDYSILQVYEAPKCAYFPLTPLTFVTFYTLSKYVVSHVEVEKPIYIIRLITKIPLIAAALVIVYIMLREFNIVYAIAWMCTFMLCGTVWILQFDVICALFILASCIVLARRRYALAGMFVALSTLYKQATGIILIPQLLAIILHIRSWGGALKYLVGFLLTVLAFTLPFLLTSSGDFIKKAILFHANRYPQDLSIWNIPLLLSHYREFNPTLKWIWEVPFLASIGVFIIWKIVTWLKGKHEVENSENLKFLIIRDCAIVLLMFLLWTKVGNPGYFVWVLPLLVVLCRSLHEFIILGFMTFFVQIFYPLVMFLPAAKLDKPVFIVEDLKYWPARELLLNSISGLPEDIAKVIVEVNSPVEYKIVSTLYNHMYSIGIACIIVYVSYLLFSLVNLLRCTRT